MKPWKEKIHRSQYLKDFWEKRPGRKDHPVFGEVKGGVILQCQRCKKEFSGFEMVRTIKNGEVESVFCKNCYAKRGINQKMAGNREDLAQ